MRQIPVIGGTALAALIALPAWAQGLQPQGGQGMPGQQAPNASQPYHQADTPGRPAIPASDEHYSQSMQRLFQAAQRLREAVQAMAQQPAGPGRDEAMRTADRALLETQEAMAQLPPNLQGRPEYQQARSQLDETHRTLGQQNADPRQAQAAADRFASGLPALQGSASAQAATQQLQQRLGQAGFSDVQILDTSYLVRAISPDGQPVLMVVDPGPVMATAGLSQRSPNASRPNASTGSSVQTAPNSGGAGASASPSAPSGGTR
jgi:hypothetical protein